MISISKLCCGGVEPHDALRYGSGNRPAGAGGRKPIVVWNCTRRCNLRCAHCYSASDDQPADDEMTVDDARRMIEDLAQFGAAVLLFSGGEPLMRPDVYDLAGYARSCGLRTVISTNGTLITAPAALRLSAAGVSYVGVSLDGLEQVNDAFRGRAGAFAAALAGIRNCRQAGLKVGLRLTMNARNVAQIDGIFDLMNREGIPRICFYHLVGAGRGSELGGDALSYLQTRQAIDGIIDRTIAMHSHGDKVEVLTVDNHADAAYVYLRLLRDDPAAAGRAMQLLLANGGNSSGSGIACVSWNGDIFCDQFWRSQCVGNVRNRPLSQVWTDPSQPLLARLRDRKRHFKGRCSHCRWIDICNGNLRARAEAGGDMWGDDPACYLSDDEVFLNTENTKQHEEHRD